MKQTKRMRTVGEEELKSILDKHKKWLLGKLDGVRADLSYVNFHKANLRNVDLSKADLSNADLSNADLFNVDLSRANLSNANLFCAYLRHADLSCANLNNANLRFADLRNANLRFVNLCDVKLDNTNLQYADLRCVNLRYTDLHEASLHNVDLRYANLGNVIGFKFKPLQVVGKEYSITILDDHVLWGCRKLTFDEVKSLQFDDCTDEYDSGEFEVNKKVVLDMIKYYRK